MISKTSILNFSTFCFFLLCSISQTFAQQNVGFEDGTTANWTCESGTFGETKPADCDSKLPVVLTDGACQNQGGLDGTVNPVNYSQNRHTIMSQKNVKDPNSNNEVNVVAPAALFPSNTNNYSFRIGNAVGGDMSNPNNLAFAEGIKYTFIVTKENAGLTYMFAVFVKESAPVLHPLNMAPSFEIKLTDQAGTIIPCGYYQLVAGSAFGLKDGLVDAYGTWKYADWKKIALDLSGYIGQSVTIEFRTHDCFPSGTTTITKDSLHIDTVCTNWMAGSHAAYAYIDLYSTPVEITAPSVCANQTSVELCAPSGYATYQWPSGQPGIVPPLNKQCVTINNPKPGDMYTVNMTSIAGGCPTSAKVALKGADFLIKDTSVCFYSGPFKLKATPITTGNYNFKWEPATNLDNPNIAEPMFTPGTTTTYTVTMSDESIANCNNIKTCKVTVGEKITVEVKDKTIYQGETVSLDGKVSGNGVGYWEDGMGTFTPDRSALNATYKPTAAEENDGYVILTLKGYDPNVSCPGDKGSMKLTILTPTEIYTIKQDDLSIEVYPNPFNTMLTIHISGLTNTSDALFTLFDYQGKKIKSMQLQNGDQKLERNGLPSGVYFIEITKQGKILGKQKILIND